jgi:acetyltransferase EpsM
VTRHLVIAGSGEHARVVAEAATAAGWQVEGWAGPAPEADPGRRGGLAWISTDEELAARMAGIDAAQRPFLVLGFGGPPAARRAAVARLGPATEWATIVHPAAWVSPTARVGRGAVILAGAIVSTGASIGEHAIINSGAIVEHDAVVGEHAHVAPGAALGGGARIGDDSFVGLNASVRDHITVGMGVAVGMGAAVVADVPDGARVAGVPARLPHE